MTQRGRLIAAAGAAAGIAAGVVAERVALNRRRARDPEAAEVFGSRRGDRTRELQRPDGAKLFIEEVGPTGDRAVIFLHGSGLRTDAWHYQMGGLDGHRLVFYDLRGHGLSQPSGDLRVGLDSLTSDLEAVIDDLGAREVVVVGHSVGGMVALELARRRPDLQGSVIKGLGLVNTTYRPGAESVRGGALVARVERVTRRPFDLLGTQHDRIERLRRVIKPSDAVFWGVAFSGFGPGSSAKQVDFVYDMLAETPASVWFDLIRTYREFDMVEHLGEVTVPSLVIGGTHDRITVPEASLHLADNLPKARLEMMDGCGHMAMLEKHERFNEVLLGFLDDTLGAASKPSGKRGR